MLAAATPIAFLPSTDLDRSRRFFADRLGLEVLDDSPFACVVRVGATTLRITKVDDLTPHPFTVFGWDVPDIGAAVAHLAAAGVTFERFEGMDQDPLGVWTAPGGAQVAWFHDPDGNTLSLTQFATA